MENTIRTRQDGRKEKVVGQGNLGGHKYDIVEVIPETNQEKINRIVNKAKVFSVPAGVGICHAELYLYPNGEIHNGCGKGKWNYNSIEEAELFLQNYRNNN